MGDLLASARAHIGDHSYKTSGGAHIQLCPLCNVEHQICKFQTGSMRCVRDQCRNPHHIPFSRKPGA